LHLVRRPSVRLCVCPLSVGGRVDDIDARGARSGRKGSAGLTHLCDRVCSARLLVSTQLFTHCSPLSYRNAETAKRETANNASS